MRQLNSLHTIHHAVGSNAVNSSVLQVPFLNLMANIQQRVGQVKIRVGGNTQETAVLVASTPDGKILEKDVNGVSNPVSTSGCIPGMWSNHIVDRHKHLPSFSPLNYCICYAMSLPLWMFAGSWVRFCDHDHTYPLSHKNSGVPFNDTSNFRLGIVEQGEAILGDYLIGLQAGNEPDLYARHGHRNSVCTRRGSIS